MRKHPDLYKKLELLHNVSANSDIRSNSELARRLGITRQAVSRWCRGSETSSGDRIPEHLVPRLGDLYDVDPDWFSLPLDEFVSAVKNRIEDAKNGPLLKTQQISLAALPITNLTTFGRDAELAALNKLWAERSANVIQITGFGGVGKTTLLNRWLSDLSAEKYKGANRVYAWSFYWQGESSEIRTSGDFFIEHALKWFGEENSGEGSPWEKAARLAKIARSFKSLLILDGLEPLQYKPGPRTGEVENPAVSTLIKELAADNPGLCIITSRLPVVDLEPYKDGRVRTIELQNLSLDAGKAVLKNFGVKGSGSELEGAIKHYDGHPLSLSLLGGYLSVAHGGEVKKFRELKSLFHEKRIGHQAKGLMQAYLDWFKDRPECELLYLIALFEREVSLTAIQTIVAEANVNHLTSKLQKLESYEWSYCLEELQRTNLVTENKRGGELYLDCHPIVRDMIDSHLKENESKLSEVGHSLFFSYLNMSSSQNPETIDELDLLFLAVSHGVKADRCREAYKLYYDRIKRGYTMLRFGSHDADQACIKSFFINDWHTPIDDISEADRFYLLSSATTNLMSLGKLSEAIDPSLKCIEYYQENAMWLEATNAAGPLISALIASGELAKAFSLIESLSECIENTDNAVIQAMSDNFRAYILYLGGKKIEAGELFRSVETVLNKYDPGEEIRFPTVSSYYCRFLLETGDEHQALERSLQTFAWRKRKAWQVKFDTTSTHASDLLVLGLIFLGIGDKINALKALNKQVDLFRSAGEWLYLPTGLSSRARYFIRVGDIESARSDLEEALELSSITGAVFSQWEAHLGVARLHCELGSFEKAADSLSLMKSLPGMDAYRFRDREIENLERSIAAHA